MRKTDVTFHGIENGYTVAPAVNVKIHWYRQSPDSGPLLARVCRDLEADPRFTWAWIDAHVPDDDGMWWNEACGAAWDQLQADYDAHAADFWGAAVMVSEGRSSGWAVVYTDAGKGRAGRPMFDRDAVAGWDAVALGKWARFAKWARQTADDVPYQWLTLIYLNVFEPWAEEKLAQRQAAHVAEALSL